MNTAIRILRTELSWLEGARANAVKELANPKVPPGLAQQLLDRLDLEMLEIECAIEDLTRFGRPMAHERPQLELFA